MKFSILISICLGLNFISSINAIDFNLKSNFNTAKESVAAFGKTCMTKASNVIDAGSKKAQEIGTACKSTASNMINAGSKKANELGVALKDGTSKLKNTGSNLIESGSKKVADCYNQIPSVNLREKLNVAKESINSNLDKLGKTTLKDALPYASMATGVLLTVYAVYKKVHSNNSLEAIKNKTKTANCNAPVIESWVKQESRKDTINSLLIGGSGLTLAGIGYAFRNK